LSHAHTLSLRQGVHSICLKKWRPTASGPKVLARKLLAVLSDRVD